MKPEDSWSITSYNNKCGIITVDEDGDFFKLHCAFCPKIYEDLQSFVKHNKQGHSKFQDEFLNYIEEEVDSDTILSYTDNFQVLSPDCDKKLDHNDTLFCKVEKENEIDGAQEEYQTVYLDNFEDNWFVREETNRNEVKNHIIQHKEKQIDPDLEPKDEAIDSITESEDLDSEKCDFKQTKYDLNKKFDSLENREINTELIRLYKFNTCLWNKQDKNYTIQAKRNEAVEQIIETLSVKWNINLTKEDVLKKLYFIRYLYLQQLKNKKNNTSYDDAKKPWYLEEILFLQGHAGPYNEYKCEECNKVLRTHSSYLDHKFGHDGIPHYICSVCGKEFGKSVALKIHSKSHLEVEERKYECDICHKRFALQINYRVHKRRHEIDKPYQCTECPKSYPTKPELRSHIRKHTGEKPFVCDICGDAFKFHPHYYRHRSRHLKQRKYNCHLCPKTFYAHDNLRGHLNTHSSSRDYGCSTCNKAFKDMKTLKQHELLHSGQKNYICKICEKAFAQSAGLHSHMKSHRITKETKHELDDID